METNIRDNNLFKTIRDEERLIRLLCKSTKIPKSKIVKILKIGKDDAQIFRLLHQEYHSSSHRKKSVEKRAVKVASRIQDSLSDLSYNRELIADIGCADGSIVYHLGKNLEFERIVGFDFDLWLEKDYTQKRYEIEFLETDGKNYGISSHSADLVLCLNSLHHMTDLEQSLIEISSILKKGALLVIKEHNCQNRDDANLLDIYHGVYGLVKEKEPQQDFLDNYHSCYYSKKDLKEILRRHGFSKIKEKDLNRNLFSYLAIYQKD